MLESTDVIDRPGAGPGQGEAECRGPKNGFLFPGDRAILEQRCSAKQKCEQDDAEHVDGNQDPGDLGQEPDDKQDATDKLDNRHDPGHQPRRGNAERPKEASNPTDSAAQFAPAMRAIAMPRTMRRMASP